MDIYSVHKIGPDWTASLFKHRTLISALRGFLVGDSFWSLTHPLSTDAALSHVPALVSYVCTVCCYLIPGVTQDGQATAAM